MRDIDAGQRHSDLAIPALKALLDEAGTVLSDCDVIAFGQGPGSFTGVRIACGLAQGMALGTGKPVVPVTTLLSMAEAVDAPKVLVAQDARMNEVYLGAWCRDDAADGGWREVIAPTLTAPINLPVLPDDGWFGVGSAFAVPMLRETLVARYADSMSGYNAGIWPSALGIARIAARRLAQSGLAVAVAPELAAPLYLRNNVAMTIAERAQLRVAKDAAAKATA
jgi:tRNA threonylcarbamoyladenosine biosynthesis protein TsaB